MTDLAAFLAARLDDDEEYLRVIVGSIPYQRATAEQTEISPELRAAVMSLMSRPDLQALSARWAESGVRPPNDLQRALGEVAAKRAILAEHRLNSEPEILNIDHHDKKWNTGWVEHKETGRTVYWCDICDEDRDYGHIAHRLEGCKTLRHLASVYAGHPDYDPAWAPDGTFLRKER